MRKPRHPPQSGQPFSIRRPTIAKASFEQQIVQVGHDLARTFSNVLGALPGAPHRPQRLAGSFGVNTVLTSRVLKAAKQNDPMAVAHMIPGPEPLRRLLKAAERRRVDPDIILHAQEVVDRFQQLIDAEAGDRSSLDAIISGWLPDAREKVELIAKQSVFRGMSQLLGTASDLEHYTTIVHPSANSTIADRADEVCIGVTRGLRRTRPGLIVKYDTVHSPMPMRTVAGHPIDGLTGLLLEEFCTRPLPELRVSRFGDRSQYTLCGEDVGVRSAVDLAIATYVEGAKQLHLEPGQPPRLASISLGLGSATRALSFDVLLHEDVYPGQQPALYLYRAMPYGAADPNDRARDADRLEVIQSIQLLGTGISKFRAAGNPAHVDMLRYVCEQRGWDGNSLRGFRCRIEFPICASEVVMAFELSERPSQRQAGLR